jgi:hypothetical protein
MLDTQSLTIVACALGLAVGLSYYVKYAPPSPELAECLALGADLSNPAYDPFACAKIGRGGEAYGTVAP